MTLSELKEFLNGLSEDQQKQSTVIFIGDEEQGHIIDHWSISEEDIYWDPHGDCLGNLESAKETLGDDWEDEKDYLIVEPKGLISFYTL